MWFKTCLENTKDEILNVCAHTLEVNGVQCYLVTNTLQNSLCYIEDIRALNDMRVRK